MAAGECDVDSRHQAFKAFVRLKEHLQVANKYIPFLQHSWDALELPVTIKECTKNNTSIKFSF